MTELLPSSHPPASLLLHLNGCCKVQAATLHMQPHATLICGADCGHIAYTYNSSRAVIILNWLAASFRLTVRLSD